LKRKKGGMKILKEEMKTGRDDTEKERYGG
jgi:hypothetical protein